MIIAGVAARIGSRLGLDTITDQPLPFASNALRRVPVKPFGGSAEGALLSALARVSIPAAVENLSLSEYLTLRDSYEGVRESFQALTSELSRINRLTITDDPVVFKGRIESVANEFHKQFVEYRQSKFSRHIKEWAPLYIGAALAIPTSFASPMLAAALTTGGVVVQAVEKRLQVDQGERVKVFNMLTALTEDVIEQTRLAQLVRPYFGAMGTDPQTPS